MEENLASKTSAQTFSEKEKLSKSLSKEKGRRKKVILILVFVFLFTLGGIFWWLFFGRQASFEGDKVEFQLKGPSEVASGNKVEVVMIFANNEKVNLTEGEINVVYPEGFIFENSSLSPTGERKNQFKIEKLGPKEMGKITISGRLFGNPKEHKVFVATFSYKPENISSHFSREGQMEIAIEHSDVQIETNLPKIALENERLKYQVKIKNTGKEKITDLEVKMEVPASYEINQVNPASSEANLWKISELEPEKETIIEVEGRLYGEAGEIKIFKIQTGQKNDKGEFYLQNEKEIKVKIVKLDLDLDLKINNQKEIVANLGDEVELRLDCENKSSEDLPDSKIEVSFDENLFEKSAVYVEGGKYEEGKLIWDKSTRPELANLENGKKEEFRARLKLISNIPVNSSSKQNFLTKFKAKFSADTKPLGKEGEFVKESNAVQIKINTKVGYEIEVRYYDENGKKVGAGPLPPQVGKETIYRVYLTLTNTTNEVANPKVEVHLPADVLWVGNKTASFGNLDFFEGRVVWSLEKLEMGLGKIKPPLVAFFDISFTPKTEMVGRSAKLIEKSLFLGRDIFTDNYIKIEKGAQTTELEKDIKAKSVGGKVVP